MTDFYEGKAIARWINAVDFVCDGWQDADESVYDFGHTGRYTNGDSGSAIHRWMQVLFVFIVPHDIERPRSGNDYVWITFDFETLETQTTTCWGGAPLFAVFRDDPS